MPINVTAWATTVRASIIQGYAESAIFPEEAMDRRVHKNQASLVFPKLEARFPENRADGIILVAGSPSEPAVTLTLDLPLKMHEYIPYSALNTEQVTIEGDYSERLGRDLRRGQDNRFVAFCLRTASDRAGNAGRVLWQTGAGFVTDEEKAESAANVVRDILKNFADNEVPDNERKYVLLSPEIFFDLLRSKMLRSRDFTSDSDNSGPLSRLRFGDAIITRAVSILDQDFTTEGGKLNGAPAKYLGDFQGQHGIGWVGSAFGTGFVETLNTRVSDSPEHEAVLVNARVHFGTASKQDEGFVFVEENVNV